MSTCLVGGGATVQGGQLAFLVLVSSPWSPHLATCLPHDIATFKLAPQAVLFCCPITGDNGKSFFLDAPGSSRGVRRPISFLFYFLAAVLFRKAFIGFTHRSNIKSTDSISIQVKTSTRLVNLSSRRWRNGSGRSTCFLGLGLLSLLLAHLTNCYILIGATSCPLCYVALSPTMMASILFLGRLGSRRGVRRPVLFIFIYLVARCLGREDRQVLIGFTHSSNIKSTDSFSFRSTPMITRWQNTTNTNIPTSSH